MLPNALCVTAVADIDADRRYASRKFRLTCVVLAVVWLAFPFGLITAEQFLATTMSVLGMYLLANVSDQAVTKK